MFFIKDIFSVVRWIIAFLELNNAKISGGIAWYGGIVATVPCIFISNGGYTYWL